MALDRARLGWHVAWTMPVVIRVTLNVLVAVWLLLAVPGGRAEPSQEHSVTELCKHHFIQHINHIIDGATLHSRNERNLDCKLTFQTETILQRFMVRFDNLQLDCNDHLYIHDGAHAIEGKYKADLSCRDTKKSVGTLFTRSNHLTLEYKTDAWGTENNGFRMVITAFKHVNKDLVVDCDQFLCADHCISGDLRCDGVVHCVDGTDESVAAGCVDAGLVTLLGMDRTLVLGICAGAGLVLLTIISAIVVCVCRRTRRASNNNGVINNTYQMASVNYNSGSNGVGVGSEKTPHSENWRRPAAWTGSPLTLALCSPSTSPRPAPTASRADRRMSGSCERRCLRRGAWPASLSRPAHIATACDDFIAALWSGM